jgi:hypothetical protein
MQLSSAAASSSARYSTAHNWKNRIDLSRGSAEVSAQRGHAIQVGSLTGANIRWKLRIHYFVEPFVDATAQEVHTCEAAAAKKHPSLSGMRTAAGIQDDRLTRLEWSIDEPVERDALGAGNVVLFEIRRVPHVDYSKGWLPVSNPSRKLDRGDVISFVSHLASQCMNIHATTGAMR